MGNEPEPYHASGQPSEGLASPRASPAAALLRQKRVDLVLRWERAVREDPVACDRQPDLALRDEIAVLLDEMTVALEHLEQPRRADARSDGAGTRLADDRISDQGALDAALRAFSHLRLALLDLLLAEGVMPTAPECRLLCAMIDDALAAIATRIREAEQLRLAAIRDRFLAILGHDLRNPLNVITIASTAIAHHALPELDAQLVHRVVLGADRMAKMITDLLEFAAARLVPEKFALARESESLSALCEEAIDEMRVLHPDRAITLDVRDLGLGAWDRHRLLRAFSNLLGNALAYGAPRSEVTVCLDRRGDRAFVSVHNVGASIDRRMVSTIFEPFERGPGVPGKPGGLGLGLFIARQIVRAHGGDIVLESSAREGTTFTVDLPIVPPSPDPPAVPA